MVRALKPRTWLLKPVKKRYKWPSSQTFTRGFFMIKSPSKIKLRKLLLLFLDENRVAAKL
jgi:hypothetical protein